MQTPEEQRNQQIEAEIAEYRRKKSCEYSRNYYRKNTAKARASKKAYAEKHKEQTQAYQKAYREAHRAEHNAYMREYRKRKGLTKK